MATIAEMRRRIESLRLAEELPKLVYQTSYEIITLNQQQLYSGLDSTGQKIEKKYKNKYYAVKKQKQNSRPGFLTPDLFLTGAFYKGFGVVVDSNNYRIDSNNEKSAKLILAYGEDIFGLTGKNKGTYATGALFAALKAYIQNKAGLVFR
jgi:hypothetical protein